MLGRFGRKEDPSADLEAIKATLKDRALFTETIQSGGLSKQELLEQLNKYQNHGLYTSPYARRMIESPQFTTSPEQTSVNLGVFEVGALGFTQRPAYFQILQRGQELGMDLPLPEDAPYYALEHIYNPPHDWFDFAMEEPIADSRGGPRVFRVAPDGDGVELHGYWRRPDYRWALVGRVAFRFSKKN
jgi:hypothetical protein